MDSAGYDILNFVHILAAAVWVGGAVVLQVLLGRARRATEPNRLRETMADTGWVGSHIFGPAALVLVIAGFGLVGVGEWDWDPWILFGIGVWTLSFLISVGYYGRARSEIEELLAEHPPDAPPVRRRLSRYFMVAGIESALLILVIADMVVKPSL